MFEVGSQTIPMRWTMASGREISKGMTLTAFAALDDGIYELLRMKRWSKGKIDWFHKVLETALSQEHLKAAVQDAQVRLDRDGARRGKANYKRRAAEQEMTERQREYGMLL